MVRHIKLGCLNNPSVIWERPHASEKQSISYAHQGYNVYTQSDRALVAG